ncbi:unnamed protein product [Lymnaea stagnalis]|uniref:CYTH domain-containing protein n=1 Tax=Lymnaea stagnalis TaxID=6523 RepID=A0AAV2IJZ9_LYMST
MKYSPLRTRNTEQRTMPRNVEIKARVSDLDSLKKRAQILSDKVGTLIEQEDTFFHVEHGRLKLRSIKGACGVLIQYDRPDQQGPKLSSYNMVEVDDVDNMKTVLSAALGIMGTVRKTRLLVMLGQTRIHLDDVEGLGHFMELEVILEDGQTTEYGQHIAEGVMEALEISQADLLDCAYMDMILKTKDNITKL